MKLKNDQQYVDGELSVSRSEMLMAIMGKINWKSVKRFIGCEFFVIAVAWVVASIFWALRPDHSFEQYLVIMLFLGNCLLVGSILTT